MPTTATNDVPFTLDDLEVTNRFGMRMQDFMAEAEHLQGELISQQLLAMAIYLINSVIYVARCKACLYGLHSSQLSHVYVLTYVYVIIYVCVRHCVPFYRLHCLKHLGAPFAA